MDELTSRYVLYGELSELEDLHPLVYNKYMEDGRLPRFDSITRDPDVDDEFPILFYLHNGEKLLSSRFTLPDILMAGEHKYRWAWGGNFFTDQEYRGKGLGTKLIRFMTGVLHEKGIGTGQTFSTTVSIHIYNKLGFTIPGYVDRYIILKSFAPFLRKYIRSNGFVKVADAFLQPLAKAASRFRADRGVRKNGGYECLKVGANEMQDLLNSHAMHYSAYYRFNESGAKLAFKMSHFGDEVFYNILSTSQGSPVAYFILRNTHVSVPLGGYSGFKMMSLMDYGYFRDLPVNRRLIVEHALDIFAGSDAEVFDVVSSEPEMILVLKKRGMFKVGKGMSFSYSLPGSWDLGESCNRLHEWKLTHFTGDAYSID